MKKRLFAGVLVVLLSVGISLAAEKEQEDVVAKAMLKQTYPRINPKGVYVTPVDGVYEVVAGKNILYFVPESGHLFFGELWNKEGKSLTQNRRDQMAQAVVENLPLDKALKIGNGEKVVIEVTDPDCPYCRKVEAAFESREDVTRYVFFMPLQKLHPKAEAKSKFILSAQNPEEAYREIIEGKYDSQALPEFADNGQFAEHAQVVASLGVRGTPNFWINGQHVNGANMAAIKKLLQ